MAKMSKELEDFNAKLAQDAELDRRKKAVSEMDLTLKEHRVTRDLEELERNKEELEQAKTVNFGSMTEEEIDRLVIDNDEYMKAAKHAMIFINDEFKKIVPYFKKNLIVIGGDTGDGKSTTVSNVIFSTITRKNPATGKPCKVLCLSNEERPEDVINRVTCLIKGWKYTNHDQFSDEQRATFREYIPKLTQGGRLTVIGDVYQGIPGWTTSVEGIETIFNNLIRDGVTYDAILLDYYQNVTYSKNNPKLDEFMCQRKLANILDQMKSRCGSPIIVMAQMKRLTDEDDTTPYTIRLKGSKLISDKATFVCELIPERKLLRSKWTVWKSRFTEAVGQSIYTGYDRGKFIQYSIAFQKNVAKIVERNLEKDKEQELGMTDDKKEEKDEIKEE
jgi:hypothetical protein